MIEELPAPALAYRFTHELVRRALYDRLSALRRAELHLRVGEALEALAPAPDARALADLAHHFAAAAPIGGPERAVEYNLLAADAAVGGARLRGGRRASADRAPDRDRRRPAAGRDAARARHGAVPRRALARLARRRSARRPRSRAARRRRAARPRRDRVRERLLAPGDARPGGAGAARGGVRALSRRRLDAARRAPLRARPRARVPGRVARGRDRPRGGDRDGPPPRRPARARDGPDARLLGAEHARACARSSRC